MNKTCNDKKIAKIVPVLLVDDGFDIKFLEFILRNRTAKNFFGLMLDTKFKSKSNIFDILSSSYLRILFMKLESYKIPFGLSGSLSFSHSSVIKELNPHWAGFRGGVCENGRNGKLSKRKVESARNSLKF